MANQLKIPALAYKCPRCGKYYDCSKIIKGIKNISCSMIGCMGFKCKICVMDKKNGTCTCTLTDMDKRGIISQIYANNISLSQMLTEQENYIAELERCIEEYKALSHYKLKVSSYASR